MSNKTYFISSLLGQTTHHFRFLASRGLLPIHGFGRCPVILGQGRHSHEKPHGIH